MFTPVSYNYFIPLDIFNLLFIFCLEVHNIKEVKKKWGMITFRFSQFIYYLNLFIDFNYNIVWLALDNGVLLLFIIERSSNLLH